MKHSKTFESIFDESFGNSYYKVGLRSPLEYASINKRSKSLGFMVVPACKTFGIREKGHTF